MRNCKQIVRYLIAGGITTLINFLIFHLVLIITAEENAISIQVANVVSWIGAVTFAYVANKIYVFRDNDKRCLTQMIKFYVGRFATLCIEAFTILLLCSGFNLKARYAKLLSMIISLVSNYVISRLVIFNRSLQSD